MSRELKCLKKETKDFQGVRILVSDLILPEGLQKPLPHYREILSKCEIEVADLIMKGLRNQQIADNTCKTVKAVKYHITNIYKKCEVHSRVEFIFKYLEKNN